MGKIETTGITDVDWLDAKVCELSDKLEAEQQRNAALVAALEDINSWSSDSGSSEGKKNVELIAAKCREISEAALAANGGGDV